jgi:hypothetical protein
MISPTTFWRGVAPGVSRRPLTCGSSSPWTNLKVSPSAAAANSLRLAPPGAAQSCQRYGARSEGVKGMPTASAASVSRVSRSSRIRRNKIHVSSGTYCKAPAQFDRRMMSQMDLTVALTDCCEPRTFPSPFFWVRGMDSQTSQEKARSKIAGGSAPRASR